jgi:flagellar biosynthesis protein FlhG
LIHEEGLSVAEVKRRLKSALALMNDLAPLGTGAGSHPRPGRGRQARVIAVTSGKGGVGKTVLVVNLAVALAQTGLRVAIFDGDLGLANVHILMGIKPRFNVRHVIEDNYRLEDIVADGPGGVKVISGGHGVRELANLTPWQRQGVLHELDRFEREVDILLIDTGAGVNENVLHFTAFADETLVVTTPNIAAIADAYSIIKIMLQIEPASKIGLVANMARTEAEGHAVFERISGVTHKYLRYQLKDMGHVARDEAVEEAAQACRPLQMLYPDCSAAECLRVIADALARGGVADGQRKDTSFSDVMGALRRTVATGA